MPTPMRPVIVQSIYEANAVPMPLPGRMAKCPPDVVAAINALAADCIKAGGGSRLVLSDLFRSYDMQLAAHMDYVKKRKKAFSPPPGGSLHEGGRALDLDLKALKMSLATFWPLAAKHGFTPIIDKPNANQSEAWHFEKRGSHTAVYDFYKAGKAKNFDSPYKAMAASAIVSIGVRVDVFGDHQFEAYIQSALIRLGQNPGGMDGAIGPRTRLALQALGITGGSTADLVAAVDAKLQEAFPEEFFDAKASAEEHAFA
ncbi:MAG: hypothetical protein EBR82_01540 [Caulobacteraceae bacterium]|nr:hypothetical protein [Caulobacteraceae bacterium]